MRRLRVLIVAALCLLAAGPAALAAGARSGHAASAGRAWGGTRIGPVGPLAWSATAAPAEPAAPAPGAMVAVSNERTTTWWGHVVRRDLIYAKPDFHSKVLSHLHHFTEDGFSEVYLVLAEYTDPASGIVWAKTRIPGRPNGREGWFPRTGLGPLHLTHELLVVGRHSLRMTLYVNGRAVWHAPVAIGKRGTPTPAGHFWIREAFRITDRRSGYWPYAMGTADYSTLTDWPGGGVVGIHGPYFVPNSAIPGRISHGCIRLRTWDMSWLAHHVGVGTPLHVTR